MLIDFRVRPPFKSHMETCVFNGGPIPGDPVKQSIFDIGKERVPSKEARSIEMFMEEMDATGDHGAQGR